MEGSWVEFETNNGKDQDGKHDKKSDLHQGSQGLEYRLQHNLETCIKIFVNLAKRNSMNITRITYFITIYFTQLPSSLQWNISGLDFVHKSNYNFMFAKSVHVRYLLWTTKSFLWKLPKLCSKNKHTHPDGYLCVFCNPSIFVCISKVKSLSVQ